MAGMEVTVRLFAGLRERAGTGALTLGLPDGARVADALSELRALIADAPLVTAVNREYATPDHPLRSGDELALIPPVSGGAGAPHVRIGSEPLSLDALIALVADPRAGAVVTFTGVTREVDHLEYEAYVEMARSEMTRVVVEAIARHGLCAAAAEHRIGTVALGEASIAIAVSAPHRAEAFAGAREVIDRVKALAPIWKRESGSWVSGALPTPDRATG